MRVRQAGFFDETTLWDSEIDPLANYHVHGLAVLPDDTILAATEGRHEVCDAGPRDLLLRRSTDGGQTWTHTRTLVTSKDGQSWGNPSFVVDAWTGEVFCFYVLAFRLPDNDTCSADSGELWVISSTDSGVTWSDPRDLSGRFDHLPYEWTLHGPGPGHGIQLDNGRLLLQVAHRRGIVGNSVDQRLYGMAAIHSDDHGASWQASGEVPVSVAYPINEARLIQRSDGSILVNGRAAAGGNRQRIVAVSHDNGGTWSEPRFDAATGTFNAVDAGLVRYSGGPASSEVGRILFSRPDSPVRRNLTVSVSYDDAYSFRYSRVVNEHRSYYSDLARLSDGTILLMYGADGDHPAFPRRVAVCRFDLEWLTDGRDSLDHGPGFRERLVDLATDDAVVSGGALRFVPDPLARGGRRAVFAPDEVGGYVEYAVDVDRAASYDLLLRYYRPVDGGQLTVTVDGTQPDVAVIDATAERADGYDIVRLGTLQLDDGLQHTVRITASGPGRGGGSLVSLDSLSLLRDAQFVNTTV